jgi:outer membrane receptor protein involved in Fe transport
MTQMNNRNVAQAVRLALVTAGAVGAGLYGATSVAQEKLEEIIVTGSRIVSANVESISPIDVITADDIKQAGVANVQDLLLKNPAMGVPSISRTNSNFQTSSVGVATIDLLNLGTSRTLVLVDGRRFVAGIPGESAVDLNTIPTQFIERVDVLTGGASAVYGSDAVAGVVNIIYKKNFEGVELDYQYGASAKSDSRENQISLTLGTNTADGKGNLMAHIGYTKQGAVYSRDRDFSAVDQLSNIYFTGDWADVFTANRPFYSSYAPQGRFFTANGPGSGYTTDANGNLIPWSTNGSATLAATGFNRSAFRTIAVPLERYLFATRGSYEFAENHSAFMEGTYASSQSISVLEPFPAASGGTSPLYSATGQVPIEFFYEGAIRVNPTVPDYIVNTAEDEDGDGLRDYYFTRRLAEIGTRGNIADRDTFRLVGGVEGTIFDSWSYEAYYSYGQTKESQTNSGQVNAQSFREALSAVPDVTDVDGDGNTTEAICLDANARAEGCVPVSLFGLNSMTPEAVAYIRAPGMYGTFTSQKLAGANFTGDVADLWAGPLGVAVGAEYREEYARAEFDPLQSAGLNLGNAIPRTEGSFNVKEAYLEANLPLLREQPFADKLNLRAAYRFADYSTVGNASTWNVGFDWAPISQLRFRAVRAVTTRAPNINELYSPPSQNFPTGLIDPCLGVTATSTGAKDDACRAAPGVLENITTNGSFTLNQSDIQGVSGYDTGNPNLGPEKGKSWTVGAVITPESIPVLQDFTFSIDYFRIQIDDAIVVTPWQFSLDQCYSGDASFCQFITRRPTQQGANSSGSLARVDRGTSNSGGSFAEGIGFTATYAAAIGPGQFNAQLNWAHGLEGYDVPLPGADRDPFLGEIGGSKDKAYMALRYHWMDFGVTWRMTYIGRACLDNTFTAPDPSSVACVGSWLYNDMQASWTPGDRYELYLGADNLFDKKPAPIISGLPGDDTGTETNAGTYDPIGRRYYAGVRVKF